MRQREIAKFLVRLRSARKKVMEEIAGNASRGFYGAGLSSEGYAGGYRDALRDVEAMLTHGFPNDVRGYWRQP